MRTIADRFGLHQQTAAALDALARGDSAGAIRWLASADRALAAIPGESPGAKVRLRARGSIRTISEALAEYPSYFGGRPDEGSDVARGQR